MKPVALTESTLKTKVESGVAVVDFWASWCGPCRMMAPILDEAAEQNPEVCFGKVNVDEEPALANAFQVEAIPTLVFFKDGKAVGKQVGLMQREALQAALDRLKA